ncbi:hypothetical protein LX36DRAFT_9946 [Colletotrichum falcatum]|nr:hypothetical protein LX36DRAFT_9946 [Colletotrichum falcatum]
MFAVVIRACILPAFCSTDTRRRRRLLPQSLRCFCITFSQPRYSHNTFSRSDRCHLYLVCVAYSLSGRVDISLTTHTPFVPTATRRICTNRRQGYSIVQQ